MNELVAFVGLPASGKSTQARRLVKDEGHVRVNKDDLRAMMHAPRPWSREDEDVTDQVSKSLIFMLLRRGHNVVCDDTNFGQLDRLKEVADNAGAEFTVINLTHVDIETCIKRDADRPDSVGEVVIRDMAARNGLT